MSPTPQTSFLVGTFFAVSYSKPALGVVALGGHFVELLQELDFYDAKVTTYYIHTRAGLL